MLTRAALSTCGRAKKHIPTCSLQPLTYLQVQVLPRQGVVGPSSDSRLTKPRREGEANNPRGQRPPGASRTGPSWTEFVRPAHQAVVAIAGADTAAALSGTTITTTAVLAATKAIAMNTLQKTLIAVTLVAASLATPLVIQHQSQTRLRAENQTLRAQIAQLNQLDTESVATSPTTNSALPVAKEQFNELLRLRGQVGVLRRQLAEALKSDSTQKLAPKTAEPTTNADVPLSSLPILQPAFTAWQQGDASTAVRSFLAVDWSARPLFAAGSPLSLSDDQMHALRAYSEADYEAKSREVITELAQLKHLAKAVEEAGRDTASKGDVAQARKDFTSLKQFGTALDSPDYVQIVQLVGRASKKMSDIELARIGQ